jgi:site-specific DNA recombinase
MDAAERVAIYARFSSDKQSDASIEDQVRRAREWIGARGGEPDRAQVLSDSAVSGASMDRPGMRSLMAAIETKSVTLVVAESLDRISRDVGDAAHFRRLLQHHGVELVCLDGTRVTADDKHSALLFGVRSLFAEQYLADLSDKTLRGLEGRARSGKATGAVAYGYRINDDKSISVDPDRAAIVRRIFEMYAAGDSFAGIAGKLNAEGVQPPRAHSRRTGPGWMDTGIRSMLTNARYVGRWDFGAREWVKAPGTNRRVPRQRKQGALVEAERLDLVIVERPTWDKVQARFAARPPKGGHPTFYLLSSLLRCSECGGHMTCAGGAKRRYGCSAARKRGPSICKNRLTASVEAIERAVLHVMRQRLAVRVEEVRKIVVEEIRAMRASMPNERKAKAKQIAQLTKQVDNLVEALSHEPSKALVAKLRDLEAARDQAQAELQQMERFAPVLPSPADITSRVLNMLRFDDPRRGREQITPALRDGGIECTPNDDGSYTLRWAILPGVLLHAETPSLVSQEGRVSIFSCGGRI